MRIAKAVVRFDLTLAGTLKVTATQPATGRSRELTIDNALSQLRADERDRAEAWLGAMFGASEELIDDEELPAPSRWTGLGVQDEPSGREPATTAADFPRDRLAARKSRDVENVCGSGGCPRHRIALRKSQKRNGGRRSRGGG